MKTIILVVLLVALIAVWLLVGCSSCSRPIPPMADPPSGKILIVYYSWSEVGNTRTVAEWLQKHTGGDLAELVMLDPYPVEYSQVLKASKRDLDSGTLPQLAPPVPDPAAYDIVFIGSPVWYGTFAPPVKTFLSGAGLAGKTVVPFCTHGGGGAGNLFADVARICPDANVLDGFAGRGSNIVEKMLGRGVKNHSSETEVVNYLRRIFPEKTDRQ